MDIVRQLKYITSIIALSFFTLVLASKLANAADKSLIPVNAATYVSLSNKDIAGQLRKVNKAGYRQVVLSFQGDISRITKPLQAALNSSLVKTSQIEITALKWRSKLDDKSPAGLDALFNILAKANAPLLIEMQGKRNVHLAVEKQFKRIVAKAQKQRVNVVALPNANTAIPNIEFAANMVKNINSKYLTTAISWLAEVQTNNADRINYFVEAYHAYINWLVISPTLESHLLVKALSRQGFTGHVLLESASGETAASSELAKWKSVNSGIANYFGAFDMGSLGNMTPRQQTELLVSLGYEMAVATGWKDLNVEYIIEYFNTPAVKSGKLKIPAAIWVAGVGERYPEREKMERLFSVLKQNNAVLWSKARGPKSAFPHKPVEFYRRVADDAAKFGVDLVIYPHHKTTVLDAEEAYEIMVKVDRSNVKISMHMCHELKAENTKRIEQIAEKMAPYIAFASVSGADYAMFSGKDNWKNTIMPLDEGDISNVPMVRGLIKGGYQGPIFIHTYGVNQDPKDHLTRTINKWREVELEAISSL